MYMPNYDDNIPPSCGEGIDVVADFEVSASGALVVDMSQLEYQVLGVYKESGEGCLGERIGCLLPMGAPESRGVFDVTPGNYWIIVEEEFEGSGLTVNVTLTLESMDII